MDKIEVLPIKLDGTNYISWSFHLKNFVEGKGLPEYLGGTNSQPTVDTSDAKTLAAWNQNNAKVITWILNSADPTIS